MMDLERNEEEAKGQVRGGGLMLSQWAALDVEDDTGM